MRWPPVITFSLRLAQEFTDIIQGADGEATESWAIRLLLLGCLSAVGFLAKWALSLPRRSEVDTLKELNSETRQEWKEERERRREAERRETDLKLQVMRLELQIIQLGGTPGPPHE